MANTKKAKPAKEKRSTVPRGRGRPAFEPTPDHRERVEILIAGGMSEEDIARVIGIARMTLREHFPEELSGGRAKRRGEVLMAQYRLALAGNASAQQNFLKKSDLPAYSMQQPAKPRVEKIGKKEQMLRDAQATDSGTTLGDLMAQRLAGPPN